MSGRLKFPATGAYVWLNSWVMAHVIHLVVERFCDDFLNRQNDPCGRLRDQLVMAARSACANIAEGSARHATSRETEMKLTDVARASLNEVASDALHLLLRRKALPWAKDSAEAVAVRGLMLDEPCYGADVQRDSAAHILAQAERFARWTESPSAETRLNALLILSTRAITMLTGQMAAQGREFEQEGGFREKLHTARVASRAADEGAPVCPECGAPMAKRAAKTGKNAGREFWGCTKYPACRGTRECEGEPAR